MNQRDCKKFQLIRDTAMAESERPIPGNFGIQTPPLLDYLQGILRGYSDGQILKELLQNAEDAGASEIRFLYDENNYGTESLLDECLKDFQGPALCSYNNAVFEPQDWDGIQKPAQSCKKNDVLKVGRFGIGFNSVYHLTDLPCIISQNTLAMIDPFEKQFFSGRRALSGCRWDLGLTYEHIEDQLRPFQEAFPGDVQIEENGNFPGTFFRFPLRKEPNTLSQSIFSPEKIRDLLEAFKEDAKIVLLFLRKIERASIYWKKEHLETSQCFVEVSLAPSNVKELRQNREKFTSSLKKFKEQPDESEDIEIVNTFNIVTKYFDVESESEEEFEEKWVVSQEIAINCSSELAALYRKLNYLPWIGVGVPLFDVKGKFKGRTFCFLPLPPAEEVLSELPVHIHGFFGVSDDRRSLKWPGGDQIQNDDAEWNKLLVNEVLPGVYRKALLKAKEVTLARIDPDPNIVYRALPNVNQELGHWKEAVEKLFTSIFQDDILYCRAKSTWLRVNEVIIMTQDLSVTTKRTRALVKCLKNSAYDVVEDLPGHIMDAIRLYAPQARCISPTLVINCLKKQPAFEYSDEDLLYMLDYILENLENLPKPGDLEGLKLLPTCDGQFATFKTHPNTSERVYMETSTCSQNLLPGMCHRFVKRFQEKHFSNLNQALEIMTSSEHWKQLKHVDLDDVIQLLSETLPSSWKQNTQDYVDWTPCNDDHLNPQWLKLFWHFLYREDIDLVKLEGLKLLPVSEVTKEPIRLMSLKRNSRIINVSGADKAFPDFQKIEEVLIKVGITVFELPDFVTKHPQILKSCFVYGIHQDDVMKALKATGVKSIDDACSSRPHTQDLFYSSLLPYLSRSTLSEQDISFLRSLTVFKEFQSKRLRSIDSGVTFLNEDDRQRLPEVPLHKPYVIIGTFEQRLLAEKLDVRLYSFEDALTEILQNAHKHLYPRDMIQVLFEWVRLHYGTISSLQGVDNLLKEIPFVPNSNNKLAKAETMYNGSNKFVRWLVQDKDVLLSEQVSSDCLDILNKLGLRKEDRIEVHQLMKTAKYISTERDVERADVLVEYFCKYPHCLQNSELCQTLNQLSWITCKYDPPHFFPKELPYMGKKGILYTPSDVVVYTRETCSLAGSSVPMVEGISKGVLDQLCVRKTPHVKEVLEQLRQCVKCNSSKNEMMQQIYEYLNKKIFKHQDEILDGLPEKWILVDDQFVNVESVYREEGKGAIDLRPFLCILPKWYTEYDNLLNIAGVPERVDGNSSFLVDVLKKIKTYLTESANSASSDLEASLRVSINILRKLVESEDDIEQENIRCKLYIPTNCQPMKLLPPDQVCYDDVSYDKNEDEDDHLCLDGDEPPIYLVHSDVPSHIAKKLGVVSLTKRLAGADVIGGIAQTGQYEPITVRLKNILRDGYQPESIPKEMVQNAEDAGASEVKFLLDLRTNKNAIKKLLDPKMESVHGPALWVYNDAAFTDEDLKNITKLGGATKSDDGSKIGQFGLGFNAVYHITDVPSFVTRNFITFFDPHKSHLERHIRGDGRGIQLNFTANRSRMRRFRDQFLPYENIFGCKILEDERGCTPYSSTLFRFPLRTEAEARKSEIWHESYDEEKMKTLLTSLCRTAWQMLLFTENVKYISVYLLKETENCKPSLLYQLHKRTTETGTVKDSFREAALSCVNNRNPAPLDATSVVTLKEEWSETGRQYLQLNDVQPVTFQTWVVVMSVGRGRTVKLCQEEIVLRSGLLPCGGVAWNANSDAGGGVFCYLPLSVPHSGLPVCINGSFAVSADRRSLWRNPESCISDFRANWNEYLLNDVVVSAYITLLQEVEAKEYATKCGNLFVLWPNPLKTSKNGDCGAVMVGFYKTIVCGVNGQNPPTIFLKKDGIYSIEDVVFTVHGIENDNHMFNIVEKVLQKTVSKELIRLPSWVSTGFEEAGYSEKIINLKYSWERFFKEAFLPYLSDIQYEHVLNLVSHALAERDSAVLDLMKVSECIPSKTSQGKVYKMPSTLLDPNRFKDIFSDDEGVFPDDQFLEALDMHQRETLKEIGCLNDDLSWTIILERTKTVHGIWQKDNYRAKRRVGALLALMENKLKVSGNVPQNFENDIRKVAFLPAVLDGDLHLESANNIYLGKEGNLVGYVHHILDTSYTEITLSQSLLRLLGLFEKKVKAVDVIKNLCHLKDVNGEHFDLDSLREKCESMYLFLQQHLQEQCVIQFLRHQTAFCIHHEFIETRKLAFSGETFPPYLFQVPGEWNQKLHDLLKFAGVKDSFDCDDFITTLHLINEEKNGEPLDEEMFSGILTKVIIPLCKIADTIPSEQVSQIPLPDSEHILQPSGDLSYCDLDTFRELTSKYKLCHREISSLHAKKLGVRDIRDQMLRNYSQNLPGYDGIGESFGQREELVTRITRIMEGYPCDFSILKELVQNADDANATEVHFVLDTREHPIDRLFYNSMSELQGPALLAYNNKPFTDDDIEGIQRLGEGSKSHESDKTGRYGIGFNVVYHLTDCPMFLSGANTLCIFDPTLQYVTNANSLCPGKMFRPIDKTMLDSYHDLFNCFFSFQKDFELEDGTLFRFPLRQKDSRISVKISPSYIEELFQNFKDEMFDILLFLKNVQEISFSICRNGNLDDMYTVTANLSQEQANERQLFFQRMTQQKDNTLLQIPVLDVQYSISIEDNGGRLEDWLVHQRLGISKKDKIPDSVKHANTVTKLKLLPKGGVAAKILSSKSPRKKTNKIDGKAFCFLPLPIQTNLPVHVDGYFALGHEARRNLWEAPVGDLKGDWNRLIVKEIIAPVYVLILDKIKAYITDCVRMGMELYTLKDRLHHYHSLFPSNFKVGNLVSPNAWDELGKEFYQIVLQQKCTIFPVMFSKYVPISQGQTCHMGSDHNNIQLSWKSCVVNADEEGYFDDLHEQIPEQETREKEEEKPTFLQFKHILLDLGFPLLETPLSIYKIMENVISSIENEASAVLKVNPRSVETWLKTVSKTTSLQGLPLHLKETRISSHTHLRFLLEYVANIPDLKLNGLPLLLTNDDVLREFSPRGRVFHSRYYDLLPKCAAEFLHSQFLRILNEKDECFDVLELSDLVERLPTYLPASQYCTGEYTPCNQDPHSKIPTPRIHWVTKLWRFLFECRKKTDLKADVVKALGNWSVLPVQCENEVKYLVPMNLAKTVLSRDISSYHVEMEEILKCLQCPIVDTTTYKTTAEDFFHYAMSFTTNLDNAEDTLLVLERLVKNNFNGFRTLRKDSHRCILNYFSKKASLLARNESNLIILKSLPCFETIRGDFVALTGKKVFAVSTENVPTCDQDTWILRSESMFLKHYSEFAELIRFLEVEELSDVELYKTFILPCFPQLSVLAQWEHITKIIDMIRTNLKPEEIIRTLNLVNERVVPQDSGTPRLGSSFYDEANPVFKEMLEKSHFPPKHPDQAYHIHWLPFLRQIGMQSDVSSEQFENFARTLRGEDENPRREKILVKYFFEKHHLHRDANFLSLLKSIPFISAADTPQNLRELHEPCIKRKVNLFAVLEKHQNLVWTEEALLPKWVNFKTCQACKKEGRNTVLARAKEPSLMQVLSHTKTLCRQFTGLCSRMSPTKRGHLVNKHELLKQVIMEILQFLSSKCERVKSDETCFDKGNCCQICRQVINHIEDVPLIPLKSGELFKARRLTKHLPKTENENLFLFLRPLPTTFIQYYSLLHCLGTTEEPSLVQYASTLSLISQQLSLQTNPNILRAAKQAMEGFFRCLAKGETQQLDTIDELMLLTNSIQTPLVRSTQVFYNDEPSYVSRLKDFRHPLMRTVDKYALQNKVGLAKLVGKLGRLKPQLISLNVEEIQTVSAEEPQVKYDRCSLSYQLTNVFSWRTFVPALKIILANDTVDEANIDMGNVFEKQFNVRCLNEITTELRMKDGEVVPNSEKDAGVLFKRTETEEVDVFISHSANEALVHHQIAQAFNNFFGNVFKSTQYLEIVFKSMSEEQVISNLSQRGLKVETDEMEDLIKRPILGSSIEEDIICLLIQDPFCHFSSTEYVGYNDTHGADEHLVYAKIIRKVDEDSDENSENDTIKAKYIIEVAAKEQIEVDSIWLYKFMPPTDDPSMPGDEKTDLNEPSSSSNDVAVFEGELGQKDSADEFKDLERTKRELSEIIEDLWKQDDSVRRTALRRLLRKWHPDKHKEENKKFSEEVFKHIRREIERMEKGIPSGVDSDADIFSWAQRNTAEQSQYWRFHRRRHGRRRTRRGRGRRGGWHTSDSTDFSTPPSFHNINMNARKWLEQARIDIKAASQFDNNHQDYFQWKSSLCFFAAEKSIRAAQFACGCEIRNNHSIVDAAFKLKTHLNVMSAVQELVQIVQKDSHYPSSCPDTKIPRDLFTKERACEAMSIAQNIIAQVHNFIYDE